MPSRRLILITSKKHPGAVFAKDTVTEEFVAKFYPGFIIEARQFVNDENKKAAIEDFKNMTLKKSEPKIAQLTEQLERHKQIQKNAKISEEKIGG